MGCCSKIYWRMKEAGYDELECRQKSGYCPETGDSSIGEIEEFGFYTENNSMILPESAAEIAAEIEEFKKNQI